MSEAASLRSSAENGPSGSPPDGSKARFTIVGIGASAGGLEAFTELLKNLSNDTGFGFVLVQHLDPQHESSLTQILSRATTMPVREVTNNLRVEANHVYVISPNTNLAISNGVLKLEPRPRTRSPTRSIDSFFESLAVDRRNRAIGVILSGTATDGTMGLEAIKAEGGITFAQDDSARYDSMPRSAVAAGCVDLVLKPEDIAKELARIAKHPYVAGHPHEFVSPENEREFKTRRNDDETSLPLKGREHPRPEMNEGGADNNESPRKAEDDNYKRILLLLRNHCGVDFSLYKPTTIQRRITRRMVLNKQNGPGDYARFLKGNAKELEALYSDVLIGVTSFFRNPEAFDVLKRKVFPKLLQQRGDDPLRAWVLGCSTGQEAYSVAMAFAESSENAPRARKLQIFATDLNEAMLDKARHGLYPKAVAQDISPERLRRFFVEEEGGYRIVKSLRETVVFARQNLISDPPFSRMDLIACRNLLIYLEPSLQKKALPTFHYALKPEGFLFLGASESIGSFTELFEPVDKKQKIFSRKVGPTPSFHLPVRKERGEHPSPGQRRPLAIGKGQEEPPEAMRSELNAQREADRVTVNEFAPPGVLINAEFQILQFRGTTSAYLQPPPSGKATLDVLKMAREGLMLPLRAAVNKAKKENKSTRAENVAVRENGKTRKVNLEVIPLKNLRDRCFLILFEEAGKKAVQREPKETRKQESAAASHPSLSSLKDLERELFETRDFLQSVQEQYEAANEELQASNEEVQSANEELQSINEELETSKEELESANEELTTLNEEMSNRNTELNRLNADLNNLQTSTKLPILLIGRNLIIRRFSAAAEKIFDLLATDVGRPLNGLRHNLAVMNKRSSHGNETGVTPAAIGDQSFAASATSPLSLETIVREVIDTLREREQEVQDKDGRWHSLRVRPYMTLDNKVDGVVLVLVNIDELKRAETKAKVARDYAEATLRTARDPLVVLRSDLRVNTANEAFYKTFKMTEDQTTGRLIFELSGRAWDIPKLRTLLKEILPRNSFFNDFEVTHDFPHIGRRTMLLNARRMAQEERVPPMILLSMEDVTERMRADAATAALAALVSSSEDAIVGKDLHGVITSWNKGAERLFGYTAEEAVGQSITMLLPPERRHEEPEILARLKRGETVEHFETVRLRKNRSPVEISLTISPIKDATGKIIGASKIARDITELKKASDRVRASEIRYRRLFETAHDGVLILDPVSRKIKDANPFITELLGYTRTELLGKELWQIGLLMDEQASHAAFRALQQKGEIRYEDLPLQTKSGEKREVEVVANCYEEDGIQVIQCNIRDITDRKTIERALRESEEKYRLVVEGTTGFAVVMLDLEGRVKTWNVGAERLLGYTEKEALGENFARFFVPEDRAEGKPERELKAAAQNEEGADDNWLVRKDGSRFWASGATTAVRDEIGTLRAFIKIVRDITERREGEIALRESEERYRTLFNSIDEGFCVIEMILDQSEPLDYRFLEVNPSFEKQSGLHQATGKRMRELAPNHEQYWFEIYGQVALMGEPVRFVNEAKALQRWFDVYAFRLGGPQSRKVAVLFNNVTERMHAEEALALARKRYTALVTTLTSVVWSADAEGRFVERQSQWADYSGQSWEEYRDFGWADAIHPDDRQRVKELWLHAIRSGTEYRSRGRVWHAHTKEHRYCEAQAVPLLNNDGSIREWIGSVTDVHERKKAEEALRLAQAQLADRAGQLEHAVAERTAELTRTNQQLEAFVYSIAHDLRAPLRAMQGCSAMLVDEAGTSLSETGQDLANRIDRSAQFMDALLKDLLTFSRVSQERLELETVELGLVVQTVLSRLENEIQEKKVHVETPESWPAVLAHERTLEQVLFNLASNALKFAAPGADPVIRFWAEEKPEFVRVWVEDNGIGIAPEYQEQVFRLFTRLNGEKYFGTGVGLTIVQKGVERMGGHVGVDSAPGQGSRFWFELRKHGEFQEPNAQ